MALMSPIIGNLNGLFSTFLSDANHITSVYPALEFLAISSGVCLAIGALIVGLDVLENRPLQKIAALKHLLITGVVFLTVDLSYGGRKIAESLLPIDDKLASLCRMENSVPVCRITYSMDNNWYFYVAWTILFAYAAFSILHVLLKKLRDNLAPLLVAVFGAVFISTVISQFYPVGGIKSNNFVAPRGNTNLPPVIHIVLDEMIGTEGIDRSIPGGEEAYQLVRAFHERFDFRLYGKAFSRHWYTGMSIPNMMNYDYRDTSFGKESKYLLAGKWQFFDDMSGRGYDINVYQTSHLNFCASENIHECHTLDSFIPTRTYISLPRQFASHSLPINAMIFNLIREKMKASYISGLGRIPVGIMNKGGYFSLNYDVPSFKLWFDAFSRDVANSKGGELFFAHFLTPHSPYILNKNCETKFVRWEAPYLLVGELLNNKDWQKTRKRFYEEYYEQVSCVYKKLTQFMENIERLDHFKNATIVLNGDHGARISAGHVLEILSKRDVIDNYSAHFSIRSPGVKPGYDLRSVSIQRLFAELFNDQYKGKAMSESETVVADTMRMEQVVIGFKMPEYGPPSPLKRQ